MKAIRRSATYIIVILFSFVTLLYFIWVNHAPSSTQDEDFEIDMVSIRDIQNTIREIGIIDVSKMLVVSTPVATRLKELFVKTGDNVKKGDVLFILDTSDLQILEMETKATLEKAVQELNTLKNYPNSELVEQSETAYIQASTNMENSKHLFNTGERLIAEGFISKNAYAQLKNDLEILERKFSLARQTYEKSTAKIPSEKIDAANASVKKIKSELDKIREEIKYCRYKCPFDGTVLECYIKPSSWEIYPDGIPLAQGNSILRLGDLQEISIRIDIYENDIHRIEKGQMAIVSSSITGNKEYTGVVEDIGSYAIPVGNIRKFPVMIKLKNSDSSLKPGMTVETKVVIEEKKSIPSIPLKFLQEINGKHAVKVLRNNKREIVYVKLGLDDGENIEILEGLQSGERIYTDKSF